MRKINTAAIASLGLADQILFTQYGIAPTQQVPFACVHHAFEHHAQTQPHAIAVQHLAESISYAELDKQANRLASRLRDLGVVPGGRVCLLVQRSIAMVVGILATLKAGGAYVPLDGGIVTDSTLTHVLTDSDVGVVLCLKDYEHRLETVGENIKVVVLEDAIHEDEESQADATKVRDLSSPRDGVYVIYTSGTTGKPKGVDVMHSNVTNLICLSPGNVGMRPGLKVSQLLNIAFDMCAWEVLGALANGCTLCVRGKSKQDWKDVLKMVDVVIATPSILNAYDPAEYPNIKFAATAGEVCPQALADRWARTALFHNSCGPTEITIVNTVQPHTYGFPLSIGVPTPNNTVYILDETMRPVPVGKPGLMWAGGAGITRGYLNLKEKTDERYKLDPFLCDGSIMFNTGDIGRWRADGQLDHLGRADDQVKVKGFRVELDGVAAAMETCPNVRVAAALLIGTELVGFVTPDDVDVAAVKAATAKVQPYYAVPSRILRISAFPLTGNGKTDKRALRHFAETGTMPEIVVPALLAAPMAIRTDSMPRTPTDDLPTAVVTSATPRNSSEPFPTSSPPPSALILNSPPQSVHALPLTPSTPHTNSRTSSTSAASSVLNTPFGKTLELSLRSVNVGFDSPPPPYLLNLHPDTAAIPHSPVKKDAQTDGNGDGERTPPPSFFNPQFTTFDNNSFLSYLGPSTTSSSVTRVSDVGPMSMTLGRKVERRISFRQESVPQVQVEDTASREANANGTWTLWSKLLSWRVRRRVVSTASGNGASVPMGLSASTPADRRRWSTMADGAPVLPHVSL